MKFDGIAFYFNHKYLETISIFVETFLLFLI